MKRLFYFLLCALLFSGCAKGKWPDQVKMSSYNVVFDAGESSQRIYSKTNCGFLLECLSEANHDHNIDYKRIPDNEFLPSDGFEAEWVKIMFDDLEQRSSLIISVKQNNTGQARRCVLRIGLGDWGGRIHIVQEAE